MSRAWETVFAAVKGITLGVLTGYPMLIAYNCALGWYHGGSADPRCVYAWNGYVEVHRLQGHGKPDRVSCAYRPEIVGPAP
jgi:hypothetical protein